MRYMSKQASAGKVPEARNLVKFLVKGLRDKVAAVVVETSKLLLQLVNEKSRAAPYIMQAVFPVLVERLGDGNARVAVCCTSSPLAMPREIMLHSMQCSDMSPCDAGECVSWILTRCFGILYMHLHVCGRFRIS